jgi:hypothetical protein
MLQAADTNEAVFPPTILYDEGWMLRLILSAAATGVKCLPCSFAAGAKWYSEALLHSPFLTRRQGDELAEAYTHADGVVGHFRVKAGTKTGVEIAPDAKQFVVLEAKMFSPLSAGTKKAPFYDQAARTVACMASTLEQSRKQVGDLESLGFYVVAPESQIQRGVFDEQMTRESIERKVLQRIGQYGNEGKVDRRNWFENTFLQLIRRIDLACWSWEKATELIVEQNHTEGNAIREFYERCLIYNQQVAKGVSS